MRTRLLVLGFMIILLGTMGSINETQARENVTSVNVINYLSLVFKDFTTRFGQLAFIGTDPNNYSDEYIYKIKDDGTEQNKLTTTPMQINFNHWSPDGSKIAFEGIVGDNWDIFVMNYDGTDLVNLTDSPAMDIDPSWSNDGSKIAFVSNQEGSPQVYVMNANGSNVTKLTDCTLGCTSPIWAPVGNKIIFDSYGDRYDDEEIYIINSDGSNLLRLSNNAYFDSVKGWSPDGTKILFISDRDAITMTELYAINPDGTSLVRLTDIGYVSTGQWSPDGQNIAVASSNYSLYLINPDGSNRRFISCQSNSIETFDPTWSPDSKKIAYSPSSGVIGDTTGIYVVTIVGENCRHLTTILAYGPQWRP
jgi:Tol biopolymer transport system component